MIVGQNLLALVAQQLQGLLLAWLGKAVVCGKFLGSLTWLEILVTGSGQKVQKDLQLL